MTEQIVRQTEAWLQSFILKYNICPFAHKVMSEKTLHYAVEHALDIETCLQELISECQGLDADNNIETTLVIYSSAFSDFDDFLDYLEMANALLVAQDYEGVYQLASFHPYYCFEGSDEEDSANYTNRSPYPMLHIIREESIEKVLESYSDPDTIPSQNIELTRSLGLSKLQLLLKTAKNTQ